MTVIAEVWAIRERGTMKYMPQLLGRGHTFSEPTEGAIPRLFHSERAAKLALGAWLKGHAINKTSREWETGYIDVVGLIYEKVDGRSADRMEVVKLTLTSDAEPEMSPREAQSARLDAIITVNTEATIDRSPSLFWKNKSSYG
jgi:hypothetical protein